MTPRRRLLLAAAPLVLALAGLALVWPYLAAGGDIRDGLEHQPSRLWAEPLSLQVGERVAQQDVVDELLAAGYSGGADGDGELRPGEGRAEPGYIVVYLRRRATRHGNAVAETLELFWTDGRLARIRRDGRPTRTAELPAPLLAAFHDESAREVRPLAVEELPEHVVGAVLAAEDAAFFAHAGISAPGIARAAVANLRAGDVAQGGSTITQQLVKNVFLSAERSLLRKLREAAIATLVELQHSKREILQAYLNQIYLGTREGVNLHGFGAAARAFFGKDAHELGVGEAALLAGMIRSPANHDPLAHPAAARERRDSVLQAMGERGLLDDEALAAALAEPVRTAPERLAPRRAPHFARLAAQEAAGRFGVGRLGGTGLQLFSTLRWRDQRLAEAAVRDGTSRLAREGRRAERQGDGSALEAALLSVDPRQGAVRAYVGGRDFGRSEFDRVRSARRQAGSAMKPIVFAAALAGGKASAATQLEDRPFVLASGGERWRPANDDGRFRGRVTARSAMEDSRNVPMVHLALAAGLEEVARLASTMGVGRELASVPALALGALEVTPWELATVYSTLAAEGRRPTLHVLDAVTTAAGVPLADRLPPVRQAVLDPRVAFITTSVLAGAVQRGTARGAEEIAPGAIVAGKTGTSNDGTDGWFVGYRPDRVTVVWVGRDDGRPAGLSGSRAALPICAEFAGTALAARGAPVRVPPGLAHARVCRRTGLLAGPACDATFEEAFLPGTVPERQCAAHVRESVGERPGGPVWARRARGWLRSKLGKIFD